MKTALIVDDHPSVRLALKYILESDDFNTIDECDNGIDAIRLIKKNSYHIIILDIGIPAMDGMSVLSAVRKAGISTRILVFTSQPSDLYVSRCKAAGAFGYISKNDHMDTVSVAIKSILSGYSFFPHITADHSSSESEVSKLSNRELDVLRKIATGMTNNEIAETMCLSNKTISTYKTRIMAKLGVHKFVDLIKEAQKEKLS